MACNEERVAAYSARREVLATNRKQQWCQRRDLGKLGKEGTATHISERLMRTRQESS